MKAKPTRRVYLLRHGETANAHQVCLNGHFDVDVSPWGTTQFEKLSAALGATPLKAVYSSDLRRTKDGADRIAQPHSLEPMAVQEFRELSFGIWEGLSVEEIDKKFPGQLAARSQNIEKFSVEGGETFRQLQDRVLPKFHEIIARHPTDSIAIVAHGGVNRVILGHILGIPIKKIFRIHQDYAALNIIQYYGDEPVVEVMGGSHKTITASKAKEKKISIQ